MDPLENCKNPTQHGWRRKGIAGRIKDARAGTLKVCSVCQGKLRVCKGGCREVTVVKAWKSDAQVQVPDNQLHSIFSKFTQHLYRLILDQVL